MKHFYFLFTSLFFAFTSFSQTILIEEDFNSYDGTIGSIPSGWVISWNATGTSGSFYSSTTFSGISGPNSYKFGQNNATVASPSFQYADTVSFWLKGTSTIDPSNTLIVVETANGINWDTIAKIAPIPTTGQNQRLKVNFNSTGIKFIYEKPGTGNAAFDDFQLIRNHQVMTDFSAQDVCLGEETDFFDLSFTAGNTSIIDWLWDFGDGTTSTDQNPSHEFNSIGAFSIKLITTDDYQFKDSVEKVYYVYDFPVAGFTQPAVACEGAVVFFINESGNPSDGTIGSWLWNFGDGTTNNNDFDPENTYVTAGNYEIKLIVYSSNIGCSDTITQSIQIEEASEASFNHSADQLEVEFTHTSTGNNLVYSWNFGDGSTSADPDPVHTYSNPGTYNVCLTVTSANGCNNTKCEEITTTIIDNVNRITDSGVNFSIYPNPSSTGHFNFDFSKYGNTYVSIVVKNVLGGQVYSKELHTSSIKKHHMDLSRLSSGNYFVTVKSNTETVTKKVAIK